MTFLCALLRACVIDHEYNPEVTFKLIDEALLVDNRGLKLMSLKLLLELRAYTVQNSGWIVMFKLELRLFSCCLT